MYLKKIGKRKLIKDSISNYEYLVTGLTEDELKAFRKFARRHLSAIYTYSIFTGVRRYYVAISCSGNRGRLLVEEYFKDFKKVNC